MLGSVISRLRSDGNAWRNAKVEFDTIKGLPFNGMPRKMKELASYKRVVSRTLETFEAQVGSGLAAIGEDKFIMDYDLRGNLDRDAMYGPESISLSFEVRWKVNPVEVKLYPGELRDIILHKDLDVILQEGKANNLTKLAEAIGLPFDAIRNTSVEKVGTLVNVFQLSSATGQSKLTRLVKGCLMYLDLLDRDSSVEVDLLSPDVVKYGVDELCDTVELSDVAYVYSHNSSLAAYSTFIYLMCQQYPNPLIGGKEHLKIPSDAKSIKLVVRDRTSVEYREVKLNHAVAWGALLSYSMDFNITSELEQALVIACTLRQNRYYTTVSLPVVVSDVDKIGSVLVTEPEFSGAESRPILSAQSAKILGRLHQMCSLVLVKDVDISAVVTSKGSNMSQATVRSVLKRDTAVLIQYVEDMLETDLLKITPCLDWMSSVNDVEMAKWRSYSAFECLWLVKKPTNVLLSGMVQSLKKGVHNPIRMNKPGVCVDTYSVLLDEVRKAGFRQRLEVPYGGYNICLSTIRGKRAGRRKIIFSQKSALTGPGGGSAYQVCPKEGSAPSGPSGGWELDSESEESSGDAEGVAATTQTEKVVDDTSGKEAEKNKEPPPTSKSRSVPLSPPVVRQSTGIVQKTPSKVNVGTGIVSSVVIGSLEIPSVGDGLVTPVRTNNAGGGNVNEDPTLRDQDNNPDETDLVEGSGKVDGEKLSTINEASMEEGNLSEKSLPDPESLKSSSPPLSIGGLNNGRGNGGIDGTEVVNLFSTEEVEDTPIVPEFIPDVIPPTTVQPTSKDSEKGEKEVGEKGSGAKAYVPPSRRMPDAGDERFYVAPPTDETMAEYYEALQAKPGNKASDKLIKPVVVPADLFTNAPTLGMCAAVGRLISDFTNRRYVLDPPASQWREFVCCIHTEIHGDGPMAELVQHDEIIDLMTERVQYYHGMLDFPVAYFPAEYHNAVELIRKEAVARAMFEQVVMKPGGFLPAGIDEEAYKEACSGWDADGGDFERVQVGDHYKCYGAVWWQEGCDYLFGLSDKTRTLHAGDFKFLATYLDNGGSKEDWARVWKCVGQSADMRQLKWWLVSDDIKGINSASNKFSGFVITGQNFDSVRASLRKSPGSYEIQSSTDAAPDTNMWNDAIPQVMNLGSRSRMLLGQMKRRAVCITPCLEWYEIAIQLWDSKKNQKFMEEVRLNLNKLWRDRLRAEGVDID